MMRLGRVTKTRTGRRNALRSCDLAGDRRRARMVEPRLAVFGPGLHRPHQQRRVVFQRSARAALAGSCGWGCSWLLPGARVRDLSPRALELLRWLDDRDWKRPMDVGGRDGSHHSATLARLVRQGFADRRKFHAIHCAHGSTHRRKLINNRWEYTEGHPPYAGCTCKGHCRYRRTRLGRNRVWR